MLLCVWLLKIDASNTEFDRSFEITVLMLVLNLIVLVLTVGFLARVFAFELASQRALRHYNSGEIAHAPALPEAHLYHLFLSHSWANQDAAAVIKRQLQLLLPGVQIFLDVDVQDTNLKLEDHVAKSSAMLILLGSPKCAAPARSLTSSLLRI